MAVEMMLSVLLDNWRNGGHHREAEVLAHHLAQL